MGNTMRLSGFRESIFDDPKFNPPPKVQSISSPQRGKLLKAVEYVKHALQSLLNIGTFKESFSDAASDLEPKLFPETCSFVCEFLKKNGVNIENTGVPQEKSCGTEGCAYFYGNKVLKATFGRAEWKIATLLKGSKDIVPVIDTAYEPQNQDIFNSISQIRY